MKERAQNKLAGSFCKIPQKNQTSVLESVLNNITIVVFLFYPETGTVSVLPSNFLPLQKNCNFEAIFRVSCGSEVFWCLKQGGSLKP